MEYKELGTTGVMLPEIGMGTWLYEGGVEPLRMGIELGAFHIDTAEMYGTEGMVGRAVKGMRDKAFIGTKMLSNHLRYDDVLRAAEDSLKRLDTDWIDLYQIHFPNPRVPIKETMRAMEGLVDRGAVRYLGVSNFSRAELQEAQAAMSRYPIVANQVRYSLKMRDIEKELLPYCQENDITVVAHTPLADGSIATGRNLQPVEGARELEVICGEVGKTRAQVALAWCTSRPGVIAIPKSSSPARIEENCAASGWRLTPEQVRRLDEAFR